MIMHQFTFFYWLLAYVGFFKLTGALPAGSASQSLSEPQTVPPGTPPGLRGDESLLGVTGAKIDAANSALVSTYDEAPGQQAAGDLGFYFDFTKLQNPQPIRGGKGGTDPGPRKFLTPGSITRSFRLLIYQLGNYRYDAINSDLFVPPGTDTGDVANAKWPMGLSHNRLGLQGAGWARQQNIGLLPAAKAMAGVDMRLTPHSRRELHWHKANEWALILNGSVRVQAVNEDGQTFVDDLNTGDVWFFPSGVPHSVQAFDEGTEFLLVFDDGTFSEDNTFLASELFARTPKEVLAKDLSTDVSELKNIPTGQLWIFPGIRAPDEISQQNVTGPAGFLPLNQSYTYHFSNQKPYEVEGGSVKIIDPTTFPIADMFSAALVTIKPGALREIHWHTTSDEWSFFISGEARMTLFQAPESSRTFDFQAGDVAYIPYPESHYIENVGDTDVVVLEVLQAPKFTDISMRQWISLTPNQIIKDTLNLTDEVLSTLGKDKKFVIAGSQNLTETNFTRTG